jgi:hypothetical protein
MLAAVVAIRIDASTLWNWNSNAPAGEKLLLFSKVPLYIVHKF